MEKNIMKVNKDYSLTVNTEINAENIKRALKVLIDNGIDLDEAEIVLDAIGYALLDVSPICATLRNHIDTRKDT